jgi:hypothetical protein
MDLTDMKYQKILAANAMEDNTIPVSTKPLPKSVSVTKITTNLGARGDINLPTGETIVRQTPKIYQHTFNTDNAFGGKRKKRKTKGRHKRKKRHTKRRKTNVLRMLNIKH